MPLPNIKRGGVQRSQAAQIPAAVSGINATASLARMGEEECIYTYNLLAEDFGMVVRNGYAEWANGWTGGPAKTVITFEGNVDTEDKLWVANEEGIWDCTIEGTIAPTQSLVWPSSLNDAGICSYVNYANDAGDRFVLLCDGENGYYVWTQTTNLWVKQTLVEIPEVDPSLFNFVMIWKQRVWFVEKDSPNAWYLDVGAFTGPAAVAPTANKFIFGRQFRFGGSLVSLHNWTLDGGNGIDDYLVALSGAGDVVIFAGTDPAQASSFGLVGSWYVGELPAGNRIGTEFSGEMFILSVQGLIPLSNILNGASVASPDTYVSAKIAPYVRKIMDTSARAFGWHIHIHPKQSQLYVNAPRRSSSVTPPPNTSFSLYMGNKSWSMVSGLDKGHTANWKGEVYWVDLLLNRLNIEQGHVDRVLLDPDTDGVPLSIEWDMLTAYVHLGEPARYKRCQYIRPMFIGQALPSFNVQARYDYDIQRTFSVPPSTGTPAGAWDSGVWDLDEWGGDLRASDNPRGANGMGRHIAVSLRGNSVEETTLIAFDLTFDFGGLM